MRAEGRGPSGQASLTRRLPACTQKLRNQRRDECPAWLADPKTIEENVNLYVNVFVNVEGTL